MCSMRRQAAQSKYPPYQNEFWCKVKIKLPKSLLNRTRSASVYCERPILIPVMLLPFTNQTVMRATSFASRLMRASLLMKRAASSSSTASNFVAIASGGCGSEFSSESLFQSTPRPEQIENPTRFEASHPVESQHFYRKVLVVL